jgi:hypothetical protein
MIWDTFLLGIVFFLAIYAIFLAIYTVRLFGLLGILIVLGVGYLLVSYWDAIVVLCVGIPSVARVLAICASIIFVSYLTISFVRRCFSPLPPKEPGSLVGREPRS